MIYLFDYLEYIVIIIMKIFFDVIVDKLFFLVYYVF